MSDYFADLPRGRPLRGSRAIAAHIWENSAAWRRVYRLDRAAYGIIFLAGELVGYENWIDHALAAQVGKKRQRRTSKVQQQV
jgi:hypothetical protein